MILAWLLLVVLFLIIESMTLGLTTIWFAAGALLAFIVAMFGANVIIQTICFLIASFVLLLCTRPLATEYLNKKTVKTNTEALIGKSGRVVIPINNLKGTGRIAVDNMEWAAKSSKDEITFKCNDIVTIEKIEGVRLIVKKKEKESSDTNMTPDGNSEC